MSELFVFFLQCLNTGVILVCVYCCSLSVAPKCSLPANLNDKIQVDEGANCTEAEETQCALECKDGYSPKPNATCSVDAGYFNVMGCTGGFMYF